VISLSLSGKTGDSRILVGESLENLGRYARDGRQAVIVTDDRVRGLYSGAFPGWPVAAIPEGERFKTLRTVSGIYERFLGLEVDRSWLVVGIGGGVVCDIAGYAASTYLRGLEFGFAATTLLAQVDAAVGGKNGVNLRGYKNLVGTFSQPSFVLCDFGVLRTLPAKEIRCGLAEIIKSAAIADEGLFEFLEENITSCLDLERSTIGHAVERSCRVKIDIVGRDEREAGERRKLNFGHTLGHALEKIRRISHGEAVAVGMAAAARLSVRKGLLGREDESRLITLIRRAGLPTETNVSRLSLRAALVRDKKRQGDRIRFVLLEKPGRAVIQEVTFEEAMEAADGLR
jgi:3-dehydroquinate synthase